MTKKIVSLFLALVLTCLCFSACGEEESTVLFMAVDSTAGPLDPQIVSDNAGIIIVRNCFEGLVRQGDDGGFIPAAAESWSVSEDGLTYTFNLRKDAQWHLTSNAQEALEGKLPENFDLSVTADDFVFALQRAADPATGSPESFMLLNVENAAEIAEGTKEPGTLGVKATGKYTLQIKLAAAQTNFLQILTEPLCMPCNRTFFKACTGRYGRYIKYYLTNGPYYLSRLYEDSYRINLNPDYVGDCAATNDAVWLYVNADRKDVIRKLESGDYSCAVLTQYEYEQTDISKKMTVSSTQNVMRAFVMNLDDELLANENLRRALACSTNTETAAQDAGRTPVAGIVPSCAADSEVENHIQVYNEVLAKSRFDKALSELELSTVTVEILCEEAYLDMTQRVVQQWQRILGINIGITIRTATREALEKDVKAGNYQIALSSVTAQADNAYEYFASFTATSPYNETGYFDEQIPEFLTQLCSPDKSVAADTYRRTESRILSSSFIIPLWQEETYFVTSVSPSKTIFLSGRDKIYFR